MKNKKTMLANLPNDSKDGEKIKPSWDKYGEKLIEQHNLWNTGNEKDGQFLFLF